MFSATELNDYLEQIAKEIEADAGKYRREDWDYGSGMRQAARIVRDRMIDMGEPE